MIKLRILTETLSDGSEVTNLLLSQDDDASVLLHCVDAASADTLRRALLSLIDAHTVDGVEA